MCSSDLRRVPRSSCHVSLQEPRDKSGNHSGKRSGDLLVSPAPLAKRLRSRGIRHISPVSPGGIAPAGMRLGNPAASGAAPVKNRNAKKPPRAELEFPGSFDLEMNAVTGTVTVATANQRAIRVRRGVPVKRFRGQSRNTKRTKDQRGGDGPGKARRTSGTGRRRKRRSPG